MFYIMKNLLINTKEVKFVHLIEDSKVLELKFKDNTQMNIAFDTEKEAKEELFKMYLKLNKPF